MRSAIVATALLATLAASKPLDPRYYVYETSTVIETIVVYADQTVAPPAPTPAKAPAAPVIPVVPAQPTPEVQQPAKAPAPKPAPQPAPASDSGLSDYAKSVLDHHNAARLNHGVKPLTWNERLASVAEEIASTCVYEHKGNVGGMSYGQNIGAGTAPEDVGDMILNAMYNKEIGAYPGFGTDNPDMSNFHVWGHFSQIVWEETTSVGCSTHKCGSLANVGGDVPPYFTVCNYDPAGNMAGAYHNVKAPLSASAVTL